MHVRPVLIVTALLSTVVGLFGPGMSAGDAASTSGNSVSGGGLALTSLSPIGPLNFGLGVTGNTDGTNVHGEITNTDPLTSAPLAQVTVHATCLIVQPGRDGGLVAVTGGTVVVSTGAFANLLHRGDRVFVKAFEAAAGSTPAQDAINSTDGCIGVTVPPEFNPVVSGSIHITQRT